MGKGAEAPMQQSIQEINQLKIDDLKLNFEHLRMEIRAIEGHLGIFVNWAPERFEVSKTPGNLNGMVGTFNPAAANVPNSIKSGKYKLKS